MTTTTNTLATQLRGYAVAIQDDQPYWADKIKAACDELEAQAEAKPAPSQIVGALSWSCAVPWEVASWLSAHPPTIERAAPAAPALEPSPYCLWPSRGSCRAWQDKQAEAKPLTPEQVRRGWATVSLHPHVDDRFTAGVRFAEQAHRIGAASKGEQP